jgi:FkbM family methyltransferase
MNRIKKILRFLRDHEIGFNYGERSYAQEGEDMILRRIFDHQSTGFYVDVGAHHPILFSNTYYFYKRGWRGMNIDAMPGSMEIFNKIRDKDINLESAVSKEEELKNFFIFENPALNTFSSKLAEKYVQNGFNIVETKMIQCRPLAKILSNHLYPGMKIDFMSIDVEGEDMNVLKSNDWDKYRPDYILLEILNVSTVDGLIESEEYQFLSKAGYGFFARTVNTAFFKKIES